MADNKCSKRSGRKDRALAEATTRKNARRREARETRLQVERSAKAGRVRVLRKRGAVARLERRIAEGKTGLTSSLVKAKAAMKDALATATGGA